MDKENKMGKVINRKRNEMEEKGEEEGGKNNRKMINQYTNNIFILVMKLFGWNGLRFSSLLLQKNWNLLKILIQKKT